MANNNKGVLVLYTGGTIGSVPKDPNDPNSPRIIASWEMLRKAVPVLTTIGFKVDAYSFDPPIDSSNMKPEYWVEMAEVIEKNYDDYEGFVIVHGTDTMVYTASVLSFMLENLEKPVIVTGSQIPIAGNARNDGEQNLVTALLIANPAFSGLSIVPEVCIYFSDKLLRGNRTQKESASGYTGFVTPNYPELGEAGEYIVIHEEHIRKPTGRAFTVHKKLDTNVVPVLVFPGIHTTTIFETMFNADDVKAFVLETYGTGNAPTDDDFLDVIAKATAKDKIVLNVTQCPIGKVELGLYETSARMLDRNVVSGSDITRESALCKLMVLLGNEDLRTTEVREKVETNLAGEQSVSIYTAAFDEKGNIKGEDRYRFRGEEVAVGWTPQKLSKALVRLRESSVATKESEVIEFMVFFGLSGDAKPDTTKTNYAGTFVKQAKNDDNMLVFDVTSTVRALVSPDPGTKTSFTIVVKTKDADVKWKRAELVFFTNER